MSTQKTIFAKTKTGVVINLELQEKTSRDCSYWTASVGEKLSHNQRFSEINGKVYLTLNNVSAEKLLGVKLPKGVGSAQIEVFGGNPIEIQKEFDRTNAEALRKEAEAITPSRVSFRKETGNNIYIAAYLDSEGNKVPAEVYRASSWHRRFLAALGHVDRKEYDEAFITDSGYGDYTTWDNYDMPAEEMNRLITLGENIKTEKEEAEKRKEEAAKAERQAKFDEAKATGKRVLLSQIFLTDRDIPRRYRDEDSDMGHLCQWAEPDGSVSESFSHAY